MKLCKLKLKNLNSFRGEVEIDFEKSPLEEASLVAITGPTGAGKTTLLDAICVALYGKTPRLSGNTSQHPRHLISHGKTDGFAEVHFEANGKRYYATWSISGKDSPQGQLYDESGISITTKVAQEVESILGFGFDTFKRSVMLAQGEFAAFLKADLKNRREILEKTAGIGIYNRLNDKLNEKENEASTTYKHLSLQLDVMPEASRDQIAFVEKELDQLEENAAVLDEKNQKIQKEKERETKRKEDYDKLRSLEERQRELLDQQPEIDVLQSERENGERAGYFRFEKQTFDTAKSDLETAKESLRAATTEKENAEGQVETDQTIYDEKEDTYQTASAERDQKMEVYNNAKLDVGRAAHQFAQADKGATDLKELDNQVDALETQLTDKETEKTELHEQIDAVKAFLDENPLPADRQQRFNRVSVLLTELDSQEKQLGMTSASQDDYVQQISSSKDTLDALSIKRQEHLEKKVDAETTLKNAFDKLGSLQSVGTQDEWSTRKQEAVEAQPIAQDYEAKENGLVDAEDRLCDLNDEIVRLNAEIDKVENELTYQSEVHQSKAETVERCEEAKEFALLADAVNHFRQHLQPGEPCEVCGSTEHPHADVVVPEGAELLQKAENDLGAARTKAQTAQEQMQTFKTKQTEFQQDKRNTATQIDECSGEIQTLRNEMVQLLAKWQAIYPNEDVSSERVAEQIEEADTAIQNLQTSDQAHKNASHTYQLVSQQFKACEDNIERETKSLESVEAQLQGVIDDIEDLKVDIASTENSFWGLLPEVFHDLTPTEAKEQFNDKIEQVAEHQDELDTAETNLKLLDAQIKTDHGGLETLRKDRKELKTEIDSYKHEGEICLNAVREKTDGLETEIEIDAAIDELESEFKAKQNEWDEAQQQLQESQTLLTQKQTTHGHCEDQYKESAKKLETTRDVYFEKLNEAGFDSPEAHDSAFRDKAQMQVLTDRIDAYKKEKQAIALEITKLRTLFEEAPFDPEALEQVETEAREIESHLQALQHQIWGKQEEIGRLVDTLSDRETLESKVQRAAKELERWENLKDMIGENKLFNFASTIILEQVNRLANGQLESLSSGRYQLKAEGVDDKLKLTIIDRWNANEERPVETLSGGESFLTSLALALALSELSQGRAQLNSLFLDEGFGTLDVETLDIAIAALEGFHMQERSVFLISHIQELTRRLPIKINVRKRGDGSSSIDIRG